MGKKRENSYVSSIVNREFTISFVVFRCCSHAFTSRRVGLIVPRRCLTPRITLLLYAVTSVITDL